MSLKCMLPKFDESLIQIHNSADNRVLAIGDAVYYIANKETYTIKKGVVKDIRQQGHQFFEEVILTLEDGTTVKHDDTFMTKGDAVSHAITDLKESLAYDKIRFDTLQREINQKERLLSSLQKHQEKSEKD